MFKIDSSWIRGWGREVTCGSNNSWHRAPGAVAVLAGMGWCGLVLDPRRNASAVGVEARITSDVSKIHAYVVLVDEETRIAEDTTHLLLAGVEGDE